MNGGGDTPESGLPPTPPDDSPRNEPASIIDYSIINGVTNTPADLAYNESNTNNTANTTNNDKCKLQYFNTSVLYC